MKENKLIKNINLRWWKGTTKPEIDSYKVVKLIDVCFDWPREKKDKAQLYSIRNERSYIYYGDIKIKQNYFE